MRVDWCVSSWFRIKNTHSLTPSTHSQNEAEERDESEDEIAGERTTREESGKNARRHEGRCETWRETVKRDGKRHRRPRVGDG